jgi:hypothetical protein
MCIDNNKNFIPASAPPKMMGKEVDYDTVPMLDLKLTQTTSIYDQATPKTCSTVASSAASYCNSDEEELSFEAYIESSPFKKISKCQSIKFTKSPTIETSFTPQKRKDNKEGNWKRKVKTELCRFWLQGLQCENQLKE